MKDFELTQKTHLFAAVIISETKKKRRQSKQKTRNTKIFFSWHFVSLPSKQFTFSLGW